MLRRLLKKLATEYRDDESYMGGDVEKDLSDLACADFKREEGQILTSLVRATRAIAQGWGTVRALYDLGVLEALPAPADGEVRVWTSRARRLLEVTEWKEEEV